MVDHPSSFGHRPKNALQRICSAYQGRFLVLFAISVVVTIALSLYQALVIDMVSFNWLDGMGIVASTLTVIIVVVRYDRQTERHFAKLRLQKYEEHDVEVVQSDQTKGMRVHGLPIGDNLPFNGLSTTGHGINLDKFSATGESKIMNDLLAVSAKQNRKIWHHAKVFQALAEHRLICGSAWAKSCFPECCFATPVHEKDESVDSRSTRSEKNERHPQSDFCLSSSVEHLEPSFTRPTSLLSNSRDFSFLSRVKNFRTKGQDIDSSTSRSSTVVRILARKSQSRGQSSLYVTSIIVAASLFKIVRASDGDFQSLSGDLQPSTTIEHAGSSNVANFITAILPFVIATVGVCVAIWASQTSRGQRTLAQRRCKSNFSSMLSLVLSLAYYAFETMQPSHGTFARFTLSLWFAIWVNYLVLKSKRVSDYMTFLWATLVTTVVASFSYASYISDYGGGGTRTAISAIITEAVQFSPICATVSSLLFAHFLNHRNEPDLERGSRPQSSPPSS